MRYAVCLLAAVLMQSAAMSFVRAEGERFPPIPDADEIIAHCGAVTWDRDPPPGETQSTVDIMDSLNAYSDCLRSAVKENMVILIGTAPVPKGWNLDKAIASIDTSLIYFYHVMFNSNEGCKGYCGTQVILSAPSAMGGFYEMLLRDVLHRRKYIE